ncbi:MAG: thiamine-phosphate kinase [Leptolyngbyaceae cyanobacterium CAN_BIN12]|nr:thiamine-phosphate kinase [Leptolyngbyaceae cyanobacterium CAN_BIN12]
MNERVEDLGEQGLLARLLAFCADVGGDDGALMPIAPGQSIVVTTDLLVDGVHFSDRTTPAEAVGWRAAAANLSDLAAMGATPLGVTVGLSLPGSVKISWVEQLYQGLTDCLGKYNTPIVGGDICRAGAVTVAIAAFGQVFPDRAIRRNAAQPGDAIVVTGHHGASRAGLELLLHPERGDGLKEGDRQMLIKKHQYPVPRFDALACLEDILLSENLPQVAESPVRIAGKDSSDGLADAVLQICRASGVGAAIDRQQISMPPCFKTWLSESQALNWALYGGEDFELVLCLAPHLAQMLVQRLGEDAAIIGTITQQTDVLLTDRYGAYPREELKLNRGFQHF